MAWEKASGVAKTVYWTVVVLCGLYLIYLALWLLGNSFLGLFGGVNDTVKATSITAIVTVLTFLVGKFWEQSRERKAKINLEKIVVYRRFFDIYFDFFSYEKVHGSKKPQKEIVRELVEFQKDLLFWAPDTVLRVRTH